MRINRKEIFENAWAAARNAQFNHGGKKSDYFAECLKEEWNRYKIMNGLVKQEEKPVSKKAERVEKSTNEITAIKDWFVRKNFDQDEQYVINSNDWIEVTQETAKAYKLIVHNADLGNIITWAPKSCCVA